MIVNCPKCNSKFDNVGKWSIKKFCSRKCANSRTWSEKDKKLRRISTISSQKYIAWKEKVKAAPIIKSCIICNSEFSVPARHKIKKTCGEVCSKKYKFMRSSEAQTKKCQNPTERQRLRDIGRKGGFGKKGYTKNGIYYQSSIEKQCFEFLENNNILFDAHKPIPNSSKVSDCYLPEKDLWIEIDGIDRDKRQKWLEQEYKYWTNKLDIYKTNNLTFAVVKSFEEFVKLI